MSELTAGGDLRIELEVPIEASRERVFEAIAGGIGDWLLGENDQPMGLKLERFPGGRLWRDLGEAGGHLWGHVQVFKPPTLLELIGPMFESRPMLHHLTFRVVEDDGGGSVLRFTHLANETPMGESLDEARAVWTEILAGRFKAYAEGRA